MENKYVITTNGEIVSEDELTHWGIKGMKWGVRRYQNKDGSLTKAGRKRYAKLENELASLKPKEERSASETEIAARKKSINEMTNEELQARTTRMRIEKDYHDAAKGLAAANPVSVSKGKRFMNSLMNDVIAPAAKNASKAWVEDFFKKKLGLDKKDIDPLKKQADKAKKLENEYKILEWEQKIDRIKGKDGDDDLSWEERQKKQTWLKGRVEELENERKLEEYLRTGKVPESNSKSSDTSSNSSNKSNEPKTNNTTNANNNVKSSKNDDSWDDNYEKYFTVKTSSWNDYNNKSTQKKVDKMLEEMDDRGWNEYIRNR